MKLYNLKALFAFFIFLSWVTLPVYCAPRDNSLIEYSYGSYGNGDSGIGMPMLWPPLVKIYQDGKVIFYVKADNKFYAGQIEAKPFEQLKKKLKRQQFLQQSRFIEMKGGFINEHGGVSYIRYLDGDGEIILSTEVHPRGGTWMKIINLIREYLPKKYSPYYPNEIQLDIWFESNKLSLSNSPAWPFSEKMRLAGTVNSSKPVPELSRLHSETVMDREVVRYLFDRLEASFSFYVWEFGENGITYYLELSKVPGWYNDDNLKFSLAQLKWEWKREREEGKAKK
jgi:hypothetical protein